MGDSLSPFILSCNDLFNRFHEVALLLLKLATEKKINKIKQKMTKIKNVFKKVLKKNY